MADTKSVESDSAPKKGPDEKAALHAFSCGTCGNTFTAEGAVAVCNGLNIRADEAGNPKLDDSGNLQVIDMRTGESATDPTYGNVLPGTGHAPVVMTRAAVQKGGTNGSNK